MAILDQIGLDLGQGNTDYYLADAQARANEAADYDPTATYAVNDLCLYEGVLKQCTTAIPVAEAWDATHWRTVTIGGQIVALRSRFTAPTAQAAGADGLVPGAPANTTGLYLKEDGTWGKPTGSDLETSSSDNTSIATTLGNLNDQKANQADLASIRVTGTTNNTGSIITAGTYFYLNGTLVRSVYDINNNATFTENTNYEVVTAGGLNDYKYKKTIYFQIRFDSSKKIVFTPDGFMTAVVLGRGTTAAIYYYALISGYGSMDSGRTNITVLGQGSDQVINISIPEANTIMFSNTSADQIVHIGVEFIYNTYPNTTLQ